MGHNVHWVACSGWMPKLVEAGVDALFETIRPKEQDMLTDLLVSLLRRNAYSAEDFVAGLRTKTDQLEDLACAPPLHAVPRLVTLACTTLSASPRRAPARELRQQESMACRPNSTHAAACWHAPAERRGNSSSKKAACWHGMLGLMVVGTAARCMQAGCADGAAAAGRPGGARGGGGRAARVAHRRPIREGGGY